MSNYNTNKIIFITIVCVLCLEFGMFSVVSIAFYTGYNTKNIFNSITTSKKCNELVEPVKTCLDTLDDSVAEFNKYGTSYVWYFEDKYYWKVGLRRSENPKIEFFQESKDLCTALAKVKAEIKKYQLEKTND